jgi:tetratricopeptide (TPR) repeat protein
MRTSTVNRPFPIFGRAVFPALLVLATLAAYSNHFQNDFHFDDFHTVVNNPFIRDLRNIPRYFTDATLFSTMPDHATWRPLVSVSLALDYWLGRGLKPVYFHLSTFLLYLVQLVLMFLLYRRLMDAADPHPSNGYTAFLAAAVYGLHPANAETVNYIIQRGDLYATLGIVASLLWFIAYPQQRRWGLYLLPAVAAYLSKAPALIYPCILFSYVLLFERHSARLPFGALLVTATAAVVTLRMTPPAFSAGAASGGLYRLTQPWVALHYLKSFFLPTGLSADTDWGYVTSAHSPQAIAGYLGVALLIAVAWYTARVGAMRPVAFGVLWFLFALLPTSLMPLAEVTNDHRMFFPFVGLSLAVFWGLRLALLRRIAAPVAVLASLIVLAAAAAGTRERNAVWRSEESLWRDVTLKSPRNGRGLMNYGLIFMARGDYRAALRYFERAKAYTPNYWSLEVNTGIALGGLGDRAAAEPHFQRAIALAPGTGEPEFYYGRWLRSAGRDEESAAHLQAAIRLNGSLMDARYQLMQLYAAQHNWQALDQLVRDTLRMAPGDPTALQYAAGRFSRGRELAAAEQAARERQTPEAWLDLSHLYYQAGRYEDCIAAAQKALAARPGFAEAYNNLAAGYNSLGKWEEGIAAATEAVRLNPGDPLARNNLQWALDRKGRGR